jgi:hypothetical protein
MEEIEKFKEAITPFLPTWKTAEVRAIVDLDMKLLLSLVASLTPHPPIPSEVMDPIQGITFVRESIPIYSLDEFLNGLEQNSVALNEYQLAVPEGFNNLRFRELSSPWEDSVRVWPEFRTYRQFAVHSYGGKSLETLISPRDSSAIARIQGFNDFSELSLHRIQVPVGSSYTTRMGIYAPLLANIETRTEPALAHCSIRVHQALQPSDISLSYRVQDRRGNRLDGGSLSLEDFQESTSGYFTILDGSIKTPEGTAAGEVNLYRNLYRAGQEPIVVNHFTAIPSVGTGNPRWGLVSSVLGNTRKWTRQGLQSEEIIRQWLGLGPTRPQQDDFENGVASLLFVAGFSTLSIGEAEGVDQIAFVKEPHQIAIMISCTTSPNLRPKIANLTMQCNRAKDDLPDLMILPAIFTPVDRRDLTPGDIEDCQSRNITLVLRQDLESLLNEAKGINWLQSADTFIRSVSTQIL